MLYRLLGFFLKILLAIATFGSAVIAYVRYRDEYGEPIIKWVHIPLWGWIGITITGLSTLFLISWWNKLNKIGKSPPQAPYDRELRRGLRRWFLFNRFTKRYREMVAFYLCTRDNPQCAFIHGGSMLLRTAWNPVALFRTTAWLRRKLDSPYWSSPHSPELLKTLTETLQIQVNRRRHFWPKSFRKTFYEVTMDTYNSIARYGVETIRKSMYVMWQHEEVRKHKAETREDNFIVKYHYEWQTEGQNLTNAAWEFFETINVPINLWLTSLDTPIEIEGAILKQIIPTLFALPVTDEFSKDHLTMLAPKMQQLAKQILPVILRSSHDHGPEVCLRRTDLVFKSRVLIYIMRWLDTDDNQALFGRASNEFEQLCRERVAGNIGPEADQVLAQFEQEIDTILVNMRGFNYAWVNELADRFQNLANQAHDKNTLPIVIICESASRKLRNYKSMPNN